MIKLENLSTIELTGSKHIREPQNISRENKRFIIDNRVFDYEDLLSVRDKLPCKDDKIKNKLDENIACVSTDKNKGIVPQIYKIEEPKFDTFDIDNIVSEGFLLYELQLPCNSADEDKKYFDDKINLFGFNIFELKQLLTHCNINGQNLFQEKFRYSVYLYPEDEIEKILRSITLYNEQLKRLKEESKDSSNLINLFDSYKTSRYSLILKQMNDILEAFSSSDELVWGKVSENEKQLFQSMLNSENDIAKSNLARTIANYVSQDEAEKGIVKTKTLNRFIIK